MKKIFILLLVLLGTANLYSQSTQSPNDSIYFDAAQNPKFHGGINMNTWLSENINYPDSARNAHIEGNVYVYFIVEKDGSISGVKVMHSVCTSLNKEAVRVISSMPKWTPGMGQDGKPVRVSYTIPIRFSIGR